MKVESNEGKQCVYPGCSTKVTRRSISGLCREHKHAEDICQCPQCQKRGHPPKRQPRQFRPISLAKAPWEQ